jgi:hypothetical protein
MLFILVMDVLGVLFNKDEEAGLLQQLSVRKKLHWVSIYADDVALFLHPTESDITVTMDILQLFGDASGLHNNANKPNVYPILCLEDSLLAVQNTLPCKILEFPCRYLGLPLSLHKLTKQQYQPLIDRIANQLPSWKADLMTRVGRKVQVQHVLTSMIIYLAMAIDLPELVLNAIDKIRKGFLWRGRKSASGGHCLVAWGKVCRPLQLGGLGISSLPKLRWALRMRWHRLQKTNSNRPWTYLSIQVPSKAHVFSSAVLISEVGNGANTKFWTDRWLHGERLADLVPRLFGAILKRLVNTRIVQDAISCRKWVYDIKGALSVGVLIDYLHL